MPAVFKASIVTPLLKQETLNGDEMKNYRPVSNLPYMSKLIEKVVVGQLNTHMTTNNLQAKNQSAYRKYYSTETALVRILNYSN